MLLTNTKTGFANGSSTNIKLWTTELHKIGQSGEFLGRILGPWLKNGLPLIGNILKPLTKSVLRPLGLTAAATTDAAIHKKMLWSNATGLIISNKEISNIMTVVKSFEESGLLKKYISQAIKNEAK